MKTVGTLPVHSWYRDRSSGHQMGGSFILMMYIPTHSFGWLTGSGMVGHLCLAPLAGVGPVEGVVLVIGLAPLTVAECHWSPTSFGTVIVRIPKRACSHVGVLWTSAHLLVVSSSHVPVNWPSQGAIMVPHSKCSGFGGVKLHLSLHVGLLYRWAPSSSDSLAGETGYLPISMLRLHDRHQQNMHEGLPRGSLGMHWTPLQWAPTLLLLLDPMTWVKSASLWQSLLQPFEAVSFSMLIASWWVGGGLPCMPWGSMRMLLAPYRGPWTREWLAHVGLHLPVLGGHGAFSPASLWWHPHLRWGAWAWECVLPLGLDLFGVCSAPSTSWSHLWGAVQSSPPQSLA